MKDPTAVFEALDQEMQKDGHEEVLYVCGGAALLALGVISRETQDVDVITPMISPELDQAGTRISRQFGLTSHWMNNQVSDLGQRLPTGWMRRCQALYTGRALQVFSLGRDDLLASKLFATCARDLDFNDVIAMRPSRQELEKAKAWVLQQKDSKGWPHVVSEYVEGVVEAVDALEEG
jgi:hypothetical protein